MDPLRVLQPEQTRSGLALGDENLKIARNNQDELKLVLAVDSISQPLTGIGRYNWELARVLQKRTEIADLRFFSMGKWVPDTGYRLPSGGNATLDNPTGSDQKTASKISGIVRKQPVKRVWAIHGHSAVVLKWIHYRLRSFGDYVFHSPIFFIPRFPGQSVATVHDLSIYKYPETHPVARRKLFDLLMARERGLAVASKKTWERSVSRTMEIYRRVGAP